MPPRGFISTPKALNKKRIFTFSFIGFILLSLLVTWGIFAGKPIQNSVENTLKNHFEFLSTKLEKNEFRFKDLSWHADFVSTLKTIHEAPIGFKTMRIQARKNIFGFVSVEKAILQIEGDDQRFRGGIEFSKDLLGWKFNLTNLDINLGSFHKKIGEPAFFLMNDFHKERAKGTLQYNDLNLELEVANNKQEGLVFDFSPQRLKVLKQRIPLGIFSEFETTGEWEFGSLIQLKDGALKDETYLKGSKMLVNMASIQNDFLESPRGVGVLDVALRSGEMGLEGQFKFDLGKAIFETNHHHYFKSEGIPLLMEGTFNQGFLRGNIELGETRIGFDFDKQDQLKARFLSLPLELLPQSKRVTFLEKGKMNGSLEVIFVKNSLGFLSLDNWSLHGKEVNLSWKDSYELFNGVKVEGETRFKGSLELSSDSKKNTDLKLAGVWDLTRGQFHFQDLFYKEKGAPFSIKASIQRKNNQNILFEGSAEGRKNFFKFALHKNNMLDLKFPQIFQSKKGSFTGALSFKLCEESENRSCAPVIQSYDLRIADWVYLLPEMGTEFKLSGEVKKNSKSVTYKNLRTELSDISWVKIDAELKEDERIRDFVKLEAFSNLKNLKDANVGQFFKLLKNKPTDLVLNFNLEDQKKKWTFLSHAEFINKKLKLIDWKLSNEDLQFEGQGEVALENYLLRGEPLSLTASAQTKGSLESFSQLSSRGNFEGKVFLASSGFNLNDWAQKMEARFHGKLNFDDLPATKLMGQLFKSYASEAKESFSKTLQGCFPEKIKGKVDLNYAKGNWELSQSLFKGQDKDSMLKLQGSLNDFNRVSLLAHYLPGSACSPVLSACLGEAFPKGGIALDLTGSFKDPETDFDFKSMNEVLDKCAKKDEARKLASKPQLKTEDQAQRIRSLKNFYQSR